MNPIIILWRSLEYESSLRRQLLLVLSLQQFRYENLKILQSTSPAVVPFLGPSEAGVRS